MPQKARIEDIDSILGPGTASLSDILPEGDAGPKDYLSRTLTGLNPIPAVRLLGSAALSPLPGETGRAARGHLKEAIVDPMKGEFNKSLDPSRSDADRKMHKSLSMYPMVGPMAGEWADEAKKGEYQGIAGDITAMVLPSLLGKGSQKLAGKMSEHMYEKSLGIPGNVPLEMRKEMVKRGLDPNRPLPVSKLSLAKLWTESTGLKKVVEQITKDPNSPYAQRTVPVAPLLQAADEYIADLQNVDPSKAKRIKRLRAAWESTLTGRTPARGVSVQQFGKARVPPYATVAEAQKLKELLDREMADSLFSEEVKTQGGPRAMKPAAGAIKEAVEKAVPEQPLRAMNAAISRDIYLKKSILGALKKNPGFLDRWTTSLGVLGLEEMAAGRMETGIMATVSAAVRLATSNPKILSHLAVELSKYSDSPRVAPLSKYPLLSVPASVDSTPNESYQLNSSKTNQFDTKLSPSEEKSFQAWKSKNAPRDSGEDYDLRGAFKAGLNPSKNGHWPDTYKKPNHPSFSNESIYATEDAPRWHGKKLIDKTGRVIIDESQ